MRAIRSKKSAVLAFSVIAMVVGCSTEVTEQDTTNVLLTIEGIFPVGSSTTDLESDICAASPVPFPGGCIAVRDIAEATIRSRPKSIVSSLGPGPFQDVVIERYRVTYTRTDGRNTPGVDVPFAFDGAANAVIPLSSSATIEFTVVRVQAKLEPPLVNLAGNGGAIVVSTIAQIDFFGKEITGRPITVRGFLNVTFSDFG